MKMKTYRVEVPVVCKRVYTVTGVNANDAKVKVMLREATSWLVEFTMEATPEQWKTTELEEPHGES
jgi:hypothetical protein